MPMLSTPFPASLPSLFTVAEATSLDVRRNRLRAGDLVSPYWGVRSRTDSPPSFADQVRLLQRLSPGSIATHWTAAALWGMWLPGTLEPRNDDIHLSRHRDDGGTPRRIGVKGHELKSTAGITEVDGIRLTSPAHTWVDLAGQTRFLDDLVACGDSLRQRADGPGAEKSRFEFPLAEPSDVLQAMTDRRGRRGVRLAREAWESVRSGVDSIPETRVRLMTVDHGFPEPAVNPVIRLADGRLVRPDLAWEKLRICIQYDGDHHRSQEQFRKDIDRDRRMQAEGWIVIRVAGSALTKDGRLALMADLAAAFASRGA
ncbi:endonuclease domain-containing protein [Micrococcus lylae]|uniref:endonuclease domain-containing protein n=1 Tax=Micrococcus lylae TaxID=1273 RepID=UPI003EBA8307